MTITVSGDDAVWLVGSLYCKTPEALRTILQRLRKIGYTIKDLREDSAMRTDRHVSIEQMEQNGHSLWFAQLDGIHYGKCNSCGSYISIQGLQLHGHRCEVCGEVTYYEIIDGSTVTFTFRDDKRGVFAPDLRMPAKRWDTDEGWLYLHRKFGPADYAIMDTEQSEKYLAENADKWEAVEEDGQQLIKLRYPVRHLSDALASESVLNPGVKIWGHHTNYTEVRLWEGEEYGVHRFSGKELPLPETISLYEAWHWAPLGPSPTLHNRVISAVRQSSNADYYGQDGQAAWSRETYKRMGTFIRHFTSLDADAWDIQSVTFRLDGPGGIADVARFCHPDAVVESS